MPTGLDILGTGLPITITLEHVADVWFWDVKQTIMYYYHIAADRQTLQLPNGHLVHDTDTLTFYGITDGQMHVPLVLTVEPLPDVPITVGLRCGQPQFENWWAQVICMEGNTVAQFKQLLAAQLDGVQPGGMQLYQRDYRIDFTEEDLGRFLLEFLVTDGTVLWVLFTNSPASSQSSNSVGGDVL